MAERTAVLSIREYKIIFFNKSLFHLKLTIKIIICKTEKYFNNSTMLLEKDTENAVEIAPKRRNKMKKTAGIFTLIDFEVFNDIIDAAMKIK